jgi:hypothetical protein
MDSHYDKIYNKIEKIDDKLDNIDNHLSIYNEQLKIHIKRTDLLEKDLQPIKAHVMQIQGVIKFITYLIATSTSVIGLAKYLGL